MFVFSLGLLACGSGSVTLKDPATVGADTGDAQEEEEQQQEEEEEEPVHPSAGSWSGVMGLFVPEWDWDLCEGDFEVEVDDAGSFSGTAICIAESQWGTQEFPGELSGSIDDEGSVEGSAVFQVRFGGGGGGEHTVESELWGEADDSDMSLEWVGEVSWGGGGGGSAEIEGWGESGR